MKLTTTIGIIGVISALVLVFAAPVAAAATGCNLLKNTGTADCVGDGGGGGGGSILQCVDGIDNDGDGKVDSADLGCHMDGDSSNSGSYNAGDDDETDTVITFSGPTECVYLLEFLKIGEDNNPVEVRKLQTFLRDSEGFTSLQVTGFFDQTTFDAVSEFQQRYEPDILEPWALPGPTGYVYITTKKKVNEIYCGKEFPVSDTEQAEIIAFRELIQSSEGQGTTPEEIEEVQGGVGLAPTASETGLAVGTIEENIPVGALGDLGEPGVRIADTANLLGIVGTSGTLAALGEEDLGVGTTSGALASPGVALILGVLTPTVGKAVITLGIILLLFYLVFPLGAKSETDQMKPVATLPDETFEV